METKHTKGEWKVAEDKTFPSINSQYEIQTSKDECGGVIATVYGNYRTHTVVSEDESLANAKLIASAPELLEVLLICPDPYQYKTMQEWLQEYDRWNEEKRKVVIKKATE